MENSRQRSSVLQMGSCMRSVSYTHLADKAYVDEVLKSGAERASRLANRTVSKVYRKVGLLQLDK